MEKSKICFVFWGSDLGGAERQGLLLARHLKEVRRADVQIWGLGANSPGRVSQLCDEYGLTWKAVEFDWGYTNLARLRELSRFARRLTKDRPDILLPYTTLPNVVCGLTWRFSGARACLWNQRDEGLGLTTGHWHSSAVRLTSSFISNSTVGKEALVRLYGLNGNTVKVIHNGVLMSDPVQDRPTWRKRLGIPAGSFVAAMVANLHGNKDHRTLLYAWHRVLTFLRDDGAPAPVLLLAGRFDGDLVHELKAIAFDLDLSKSVRFLGKVDDITGLLMASDLCVHSSKHEGLPNGVLEAMAAGLPVVASDIMGIREALGAENLRYLAAAGNSAALADKMGLFIKDRELCATVGNRNRLLVESEFSPGAMCQKMSGAMYSHE